MENFELKELHEMLVNPKYNSLQKYDFFKKKTLSEPQVPVDYDMLTIFVAA